MMGEIAALLTGRSVLYVLRHSSVSALNSLAVQSFDAVMRKPPSLDSCMSLMDLPCSETRLFFFPVLCESKTLLWILFKLVDCVTLTWGPTEPDHRCRDQRWPLHLDCPTPWKWLWVHWSRECGGWGRLRWRRNLQSWRQWWRFLKDDPFDCRWSKEPNCRCNWSCRYELMSWLQSFPMLCLSGKTN